MGDTFDIATFVIVIVAFVIGYSMVSYIVQKMKNIRSENGYNDKKHEKENDESKNSYSQNNSFYEDYDERESKYAGILGIEGITDPIEIKKKYKQLMNKYHPDKVEHLGEEFQKIAEIRTKEINAAFTYFRGKYNL